jgi:hypothetical protein
LQHAFDGGVGCQNARGPEVISLYDVLRDVHMCGKYRDVSYALEKKTKGMREDVCVGGC